MNLGEYEPESVIQIIARLQRQVQSVGDACARIKDDFSSVQVALGMKEAVNPEIADIIRVTAVHCHVTIAQLMGGGNYADFFAARAVAMYLCRKMLLLSMPVVGRHFNKHHTTVLHAIGQVVAREQLKRIAEEIEAKLTKGTANGN